MLESWNSDHFWPQGSVLVLHDKFVLVKKMIFQMLLDISHRCLACFNSLSWFQEQHIRVQQIEAYPKKIANARFPPFLVFI